MTKIQKILLHPSFKSFIPVGLIAIALTYLAIKSFFLNTDPVDFKYIWLAGDMWNKGINPYSEEFKKLGHQIFIGYNDPKYWYYPPNWWPLAKTIAFLSYESASTVWRTISAILILLGSALVIKNYHQHIAQINPLRASIFIFFVCFMSATPMSLSLGQTSGLIYFGLTCFIAAYINGSKLLMVFAVSILMLKPHIGIVACGFLLTSPVWISTIIWAAIISILMSFPALKLAGIESFISTFIEQTKTYGSFVENNPHSATGLRNLLDVFLNLKYSIAFFSAIGFLASLFLGWGTRRISSQTLSQNEIKLLALSLLISLIILVIPLHIYDLFLVAPIIMLLAGLHQRLQLIVFLILAMFFRANNLAELTGIFHQETMFKGSFIVSLASLALFLSLFGYNVLRNEK